MLRQEYIYVHPNLKIHLTRVYPQSKTICIDKRVGKHLWTLKNNQHNEALANKFGSFKKQLGVWGSASEEFCKFQPHLNLANVFPAIKRTQTCCINMNISLLENWQFHHKLVPRLLHMPGKTILTIQQNMKLKAIQKSHFFNSLVKSTT